MQYEYNYTTMKMESAISVFHIHLAHLIKLAKKLVARAEIHHIDKLESDIYIGRSSVPDCVIRQAALEIYKMRKIILDGRTLFDYKIDESRTDDKSVLVLINMAKKYKEDLDDDEKDEILNSVKVLLFTCTKYIRENRHLYPKLE